MCGCCIPLEVMFPVFVAWLNYMGVFRYINVDWFTIAYWKGTKRAPDIQVGETVSASCDACCSSKAHENLRARPLHTSEEHGVDEGT